MGARGLVIAVAATCLVGLASVEAAEPRRTMRPYTLEDVNHHFGAPNTHAGVWDTNDSYVFTAKKGENAVSVMVLDDREVAVSATVVQWTTDFEQGGASVGHAVTYSRFCTETSTPVPVDPGLPVEIMLQKGTCEDGTPSLPTEGDIVVDFHRIP